MAQITASPALWMQGRASFLEAQPLSNPPFTGNRVLAVADPGTRVDHCVRRLARACTALALDLEQSATALEAAQSLAPACGGVQVQGSCVSVWQQGTAIPGRQIRVQGLTAR